MANGNKQKYSDVISVRLTKNEKRKFDLLMEDRQITKSAFMRGKIKNILKSFTKV
jgi:hypothetical protein